MKKIVMKVLIFSSCFVLFLSFLNIHAEDLSEHNESLKFAILSDVHICESDNKKSEKFKNALSTINRKIPNIDKYIFTGDFTNNGYDTQYNLFNNICFENGVSKDNRLIVMGNHDYWNELNIIGAQNRFKNELNQNLCLSEKIKGYTFIVLSTENDYVHGYYSEISLEFAKREIEKSIKEDVNRPIFIFAHQPPKDTIQGSNIWGNNDLVNAFDDYPQVILFAGHSHFPLNDERGIYQENYTIVTAGGIGGIDLEDGKIEGERPIDNEDASQGLIVEVSKNNKVIITRMDYLNDEEIKNKWIIDTFDKSEFKYTNIRAEKKKPYFTLGSVAKITNRKVETVNIIFPQGKDNDMVNSYKIEVYEYNKGNSRKNITETKSQEFTMFSKFYLGKHMPEKLDLTLYNIDINKNYIVKIYAVDSFNNLSDKYLSCIIPKTLNS